MARKQVVEIECSRCERKEYRESRGVVGTSHVPATGHLIVDSSSAETPSAFKARLLNLEGGHAFDVRFEDLCAPCHRTVLAALGQIGKRIEGVSPDRVVKSPAKKIAQELTAEAVAKGKGAGPTGPTPGTHAPTASKNPALARSS